MFRTNQGRGSNGHGVALFSGSLVAESANATNLQITTQPGLSGATPYTLTPQPVVTAKKSLGTTDTAYATNVVATLNVLSGSPVLSGTTTKTPVSGVATFTDLVVTGAGTWTITFTSGTLASAVSSTGTTTSSSAATKLTITTAPGLSGSTPYTLSPQPVVAAQNAGNSTDTSYVTNVVAALNVLSGSPVLSGTTTKTPVSGVATFTDLVVTGAGTWTITFTSGSLTSATSSTGTTTPAGGTTFTNAIHFAGVAHAAIAAQHASYNNLSAFMVAILIRTTGAQQGAVMGKGDGSTVGWFYRDNNPGGGSGDFTAQRATTADFRRTTSVTADNSWQWLFIGYDWSTNRETRAVGPMGGTIALIDNAVTCGGLGANALDGASPFSLGYDGVNSSDQLMEVRFVGVVSSVLSLANMQAIADDALAQAALFIDYWKPAVAGGSGTSIPSGKSVLPALVTSGATVV